MRRASAICTLTAQCIETRTSTPAEFAAIIRADAEVWAKVVKVTGVKIE